VEDDHLGHTRRRRARARGRRPGSPPHSTLFEPLPVRTHRDRRVSQGRKLPADRFVQAARCGLCGLEAVEGAARAWDRDHECR